MSQHSIPATILEALTNNEEFTRKSFPYLKKEYFQLEHQKEIFDVISDYFTQYDSIPTLEILKIELNARNLIETIYNECIEEVNQYSNIKKDTDWLLNTAEKYCKDRAIYIAILQAIQIADGNDKKNLPGAIPEILEKALGVSFDTSIGHDYFEDAAERYDYLTLKENKVPFDIDILNQITKGGYSFKTLNLVVANTGVGKTIFGCHYAAKSLQQGYNVLYISLEMAAEKIAERIDANLLDINLDEIAFLQKDSFLTRLQKVKEKTNGKLIIQEYPPTTAHVGHFKTLIQELKQKKGFTPQIIIIDYLNIAASQRCKSLDNTNTLYTAVAEELRSLAVITNTIVLSFTQFNREGMKSSDGDITDTAGAIGITYTADSYFSMSEPEELAMMNQIMFKQLKNRYDNINKNRRFIVGLNKAKMTFYDVEDSAQNVVNEIDLYKEQTKPKPMIKSTGKKDFNKLKYG